MKCCGHDQPAPEPEKKPEADHACCGGAGSSGAKEEATRCGCGGGETEPGREEVDEEGACCGGGRQPAASGGSCCSAGDGAADPEPKSSCCGGGGGHDHEGEGSCCGGGKGRIDWLLWGSLVLVAAGMAGHFLGGGPKWWGIFAHGSWELMSKAWWGILIGIAAVGILGQVPKEVVAKLLGKGGTMGGIVRATLAGTLLDLCNHGILMVGMQLYRKGASLGQTIAFLVSSPWNSLSLTLILIGLIGLKWTLAFVGLSMLVGVIAGRIADALVKSGTLPANPHAVEVDGSYHLRDGLREAWQGVRPGDGNLRRIVRDGLSESKMILRWIFFGIAMAGAIRAFVPDAVFSQFFGPSLVGLLLTLVATTVIEVCSEGSSPIAADLLNRAGAPGNAFTFLMAGAATDYTEIMALRETTKSWKATFALPLITTPQVLLIGWLLNHYGG